MLPPRRIRVQAVKKSGATDSDLERDLQFEFEDIYTKLPPLASSANKTTFAACTTDAQRIQLIAKVLGLV
jgi:hypothetical protein